MKFFYLIEGRKILFEMSPKISKQTIGTIMGIPTVADPKNLREM